MLFKFHILSFYTLWISRCIAAARERIPGSIDNYVTGVSECSQQRGNLKDDRYIPRLYLYDFFIIDTA
ncbi:hypothetical protein [Photorhabdus bodei]|uniref:Secreted protein n=1 Tax=Photorhabdus bodei TaxID=2029681 RepID=A0ABX0AMT6_9GAMM|nr:hypothetical protein [Photorhabdus bodei]NDL00200.1 hypothetical protein [Photorhabdus bodei]NDL02917.1 hypothetical protein [Photorhabdus bodei]NDL08693.1 hypothetical protein [Photorhabdus bodei]